MRYNKNLNNLYIKSPIVLLSLKIEKVLVDLNRLLYYVVLCLLIEGILIYLVNNNNNNIQ